MFEDLAALLPKMLTYPIGNVLVVPTWDPNDPGGIIVIEYPPAVATGVKLAEHGELLQLSTWI